MSRIGSASLIAAAISLFATAAVAGPGIEFDRMPVGCSWIIEYSNGNRWLETYIGKKGRSHVVETVEAANTKQRVKTTKFNAQGFMTERNWGGGKWERFSPYSCFGVPGDCRFKFSNADGARGTIKNDTEKKGGSYVVRSGYVGGEAFPDEWFKIGPFGLMVSNKASNYSARITKFVNCGLDSS